MRKFIVFIVVMLTSIQVFAQVEHENAKEGTNLSYNTEINSILTSPTDNGNNLGNNVTGRETVTILNETFEGAFPSGSWSLLGSPTWDDENAQHHGGSWAAWCAGSSMSPSGNAYADNMSAEMIYGPFSLDDAYSASLSFWSKTSTENNFDYLQVKIYYYDNGSWAWSSAFYETGNANTWHQNNITSFNSFVGYDQVKVGFLFYSDSSVCSYAGSWIDDIVITKNVPNQLLLLNHSNVSLPSTSGIFNLGVNSNLDWYVTEEANWLSCSPSSGSGDGTIHVSYSENTSTAPRTAEVTVHGGYIMVTCTFTQQPVPPSYLTITPTTQSVPNTSGTFPITVTSNTSWTVSDNANWITVTPNSGSNNDDVTISYTANSSSNVRTGTVTFTGVGVTDRTCTVTQDPASYLTIAPTIQSLPNTQGNFTINVSSNVSWSASDNVNWLTLSPSSGNGDGYVTVSYSANTTTSSRTGTVTFTGTGGVPSTSCTVTQDPNSYLTIDPTQHLSYYTSGSFVITVSSNINWSVSDNANWLSCSTNGGSGSGQVTIYETENTSTSPRTGVVTFSGIGVTDQQCTVTQQGTTHLIISPTSQSVPNTSGSFPITVSSNVSWNVSDDANWITLSASSGSNNGSITVNYTANTTTSYRTGTITFTGTDVPFQTCTVTQDPPSVNSINPTIFEASAYGGTFPLSIATVGTWSLSDNANWLSCSPVNGTGSSTTTVTIQPFTGTTRTGVITLNFNSGTPSTIACTVTQYGSGNQVTPSSISVSSIGETLNLSISTGSSWSLYDDASWITCTPTSESGSANSIVTIDANTGAERTGTITVVFDGGSPSTAQCVITQNAAGNSISPATYSTSANGHSFVVWITCDGSWTLSDDSSWLTHSTSSGNYSGSSTITISENTGAARTGTVTVTFNDGTPSTATCTIHQEGIIPQSQVTIGDGSQQARVPIDMYWMNSLFECLYMQNEIGITSGIITGISFYNNFQTNLPNKPTVIWMGNTTLSNLNNGWIPAGQLTQVFNGNVNYPSGMNVINFTFSTPFNYTGGSLVLMVHRPMDTAYYSSSDYFLCQTIGSNRARVAYSDTTPYYPTDPPNNSTLSGQFPKTTLIFSTSTDSDDSITPTIATGLSSIYPNPFNPETTIGYSIDKNELVIINIFNVKGQIVKTLLNEPKASGDYSIVWNGTDSNGTSLPSGVYFVQMRAGIHHSCKRMMLMK